MSDQLSSYHHLQFKSIVRIVPHSLHLSKDIKDDAHLTLSIGINTVFIQEIEQSKSEFHDI